MGISGLKWSNLKELKCPKCGRSLFVNPQAPFGIYDQVQCSTHGCRFRISAEKFRLFAGMPTLEEECPDIHIPTEKEEGIEIEKCPFFFLLGEQKERERLEKEEKRLEFIKKRVIYKKIRDEKTPQGGEVEQLDIFNQKYKQ